MKNYRIRRMSPGHENIDQVQKMDDFMFGPHCRWLDYTNTEWFVAYEHGAPWLNPVAYAGVQWLNETEAFFCRAGVLDDHRGQGLHLQLIRKRYNLCRDLGIKKIYTYTTCDNIWSMRNLISNKFRPCLCPGRHQGTELAVGEDVVYWTKHI